MTQQPVLSVVDYAAWEKGYKPPTEHTLIDALSYRGAKVFSLTSAGPTTVWVVYKTDGGVLTPANRKVLRAVARQILSDIDMLDENTIAATAQLIADETVRQNPPSVTLESS